ncbi:hypothetical protein EJ05DRAFT_476765 [Pseudovirgaria hyperparasitica]|uniref:dipeptidyl-peptidase IV n=1 Tax=Pseudovirgaria hyperparasitica TaxID=470096 RepID=A0A6A6W6I1_9PEZI|nr:uncharacterized protein EJ05DRAFT_476765 [Pseudovirgaria hyperparasitica]KAF2757516.1 hypothetical protein EJ05DRAFT_476765 [Pseudovirgaria hyperparasitica]
MLYFLSLAAVALSSLVYAIDPPRVPHQPLGNGGNILAFNETIPTSFSARTLAFDWVSTADGEDGVYIFSDDDGALTFQNVVTGEQTEFLAADKIPSDYHEYWIKPDLTQVLWSVNYTKQYRYSYFADYLVQDVASGELTPLVEDQAGDLQYAEWSPTENQIAFVRGNNIFVWSAGKVSQITEDGDADHFNGVPDWVYEEEIFGGRSTLWFSPDGEYIAFLSFDESGVKTFRIPYYMDNQELAPPYPRELELRYPKVGETNPTVSFHLLKLDSLETSEVPIDAFEADDLVIGEVSWLTDGHSDVIYRAFNRVQDQEKHVVVKVEAGSSSVTRERDGTDGWLDNTLSIVYLGETSSGNATYRTNSTTYYLDVSDVSGWNHIYLYPVHGGKEIALTSGEWEVRSILKVDNSRNLVYYTSTEHHSTESHVYSVNYQTLEKTALVDDSVPAMYEASFSTGGTYYILNYRGPDVPYQELYNVNSSEPIRAISDNKALYDRLHTYNLPNITYFELEHPEGFTLNAMLRLPPNFDPSKQYPVIFLPYGGPGAQEVTKAFQSLNWDAYVTSDPELEFVTYTVDNRGTGFKGRDFRASVTSRLGYLEPRDQVWAAKQLAEQNPWVATDKIGMWGWSYGGYLTSKTLELADPIFSFGVITAPVTDWRFYDSMYTERYMKTPALNPAGYNISGVYNTTGFKTVDGGFLIQHGSGDDNVHWQNSAVLVDRLVGAGVGPERMQVQWFTDSDHGIMYNGANSFLYKQLTRFVWQMKNRKDGAVQHQWSKRADRGAGGYLVVDG